ncbi:receptor-like protein 34 isoform X2 [Ziziphus jujuba]|uniref:Receptor-like protein 34 isoform X2 n=1 Tax=Ziziphus jujuba TaxID=326968 RepID=A0ABM4AH71_ZIZJJ|nr:receptor-like protein 34 isoform X2 [Ziziphus jujuba]
MGWSSPWLCLLWFLFLSLALSYPSSNSSLCHLHESSALLQFKNSFSIDNFPGYAYCGFDEPEAEASNSKTLSWKNGTDCCTWSGVTCDKTEQLLGHVPLNLAILDLCDNLLSGRIPSWLYSIPTLEYLNVQGNQFSGSIEEFQYGSLVHLNLGYNKLHGPFPASIFQQVNLRYLRLPGNKLSGVVDLHQFSKLKNLRRLDLSYNEISVSSNNPMDYTLSNILYILELSSCNMSEFPYSLRASETLGYLDLSYNRIQGNIPKWLWNVGKKNLYHLNLSHNFLTNVEQLPWKYLGLLDLRFNLIQGHLPIPPPSTSYFFISNNQLIGELPSLICSLTFIQVLDLSNNNLNGSIPMCLGNLNHLSVLDLKMNMFDGVIPTTLAKGNSLRNINLNGNRLEGPLPQALLNCRNLEILDLGSNLINDTFPHWLESLPMLQVLILRSNNFHGSIDGPNVRLPFQKLRIMDLSYNQFNGRLPTKYFENLLAMVDEHVDKLRYMGENISYSDNGYYQDSVIVTIKGFDMELEKIQNIFTTIDFSMNNFEGEIPELIGNLKGLKGLNLSHNNISGHIPQSLRNLTNLEWLDLSSNELSGSIPMQLIEMVWLEVLNLSQNRLVGAIPRGNQFDSFGKDAFIWNLGLCGFQLSIECDDRDQQPSPSEGDPLEAANEFDWKFAMLMGYGCGLVIGISVGSMLFSDKRLACFIRKVGGEQWIELLRRQKKNKKKKKKDLFTNKIRNQ